MCLGFQLADFGDAVLVRDMKRQDDEYGGITWNRGMDWYRAPVYFHFRLFSDFCVTCDFSRQIGSLGWA